MNTSTGSLIDEILANAVFRDAPPVLLDLGASGIGHPSWSKFVDKSVLLSFDPDARAIEAPFAVESEDRRRIFEPFAATVAAGDHRLYLTKSPYCSSTLRPDKTSLAEWAFAELFDVEREAIVP